MWRELILRKLRFNQTLYYGILFPGVIIHEIAHLVACLITFTPVKKVKFFSQTGGFVIHQKSRIPYLGDFIISVAPLILGLFLSSVLINLIYPQNNLSFHLASIIYLYLLISIIMTMIPSLDDVKSSLPVYLASIVVLISFHQQINVPYFTNVLFLLSLIWAILILIYLALVISGQRKIFNIR